MRASSRDHVPEEDALLSRFGRGYFAQGILRCALAPAILAPVTDDPLLPVLAYAQENLAEDLSARFWRGSGWTQHILIAVSALVMV